MPDENIVHMPRSNIYAGDVAAFVQWLRENADKIEEEHAPDEQIKFAATVHTVDGLHTLGFNVAPLDYMALGVVLQTQGAAKLKD